MRDAAAQTATAAAPAAPAAQPAKRIRKPDPRTERTRQRLAMLPHPAPPAVKNARLASHLDAALTDLPEIPATEQHMRIACALIDAAAETLPPVNAQPGSDTANGTGGNADANGNGLGNSIAPLNDGTIRDAEGFRAWVNESPGTRARIAVFLSEASSTGRLVSAMDATGVTLGVLSCMEQRHPAIRAAVQRIRRGYGTRLVDRARESVYGVLDHPESQLIELKAASIAMQYGPKDGSSGSGDGSEDAGGVQIVINMGAPPATADVIPMKQVNDGSMFVQSR